MIEDHKKEFDETVIFTFCFNPKDKTMTFAGNITIIDAVRLLQDRIFESIVVVKPPDGLDN